MESTSLKSLAKAIVATASEIKGLEKDQTVGTGRNAYKAISNKAVQETVGKAMQKNGLAMLPIDIQPSASVDVWEETYSGNPVRKRQVFVEVIAKYLLVHMASGESVEITGYGHGIDSQDKAAGKATTYALKNAMLYIFQVPVGDEFDGDTAPAQTVKPQEKPELKTEGANWEKAENWLIKKKGEINVAKAVATLAEAYTLPADTVKAIKTIIEDGKK